MRTGQAYPQGEGIQILSSQQPFLELLRKESLLAVISPSCPSAAHEVTHGIEDPSHLDCPPEVTV